MSTTGSFVERPIRVALVTNIPAPYRVPVYERLARMPGCDLHMIFCSGSEPDRHWQIQAGDYRSTALRERFVTVKGRFIHVNPDVWSVLQASDPDVVITTGYNPTHLIAFAWAVWRGRAHVVMTDGTLRSEATLSGAHRFLRRRVFARSQAFVGPSEGAMDLFRSYGLPADRLFKSHLCADNDAFLSLPDGPRPLDLLFCGRLVAIKNPLFALDVARRISGLLGRRVSLGYLGSGEMESQVREAAARLTEHVDVTFMGFAQPAELPQRYAQARLFLFPTSWDPWGVVANEACAAGVPVLVTPHAGAVGDLVIDGVNGLVLPLDAHAWAEAGARLLNDPVEWARLSAAARARVKGFSYDAAALGLWQAVQRAMADRKEQA